MTVEDNKKNVGVAFALVIGAGASTGIGASVVFFPRLVRLASRKTLASGLGFSAGVMTYVSFVEIFQKSVIGFEEAGHSDKNAYTFATLCFFAGVVFMTLLGLVVHHLLGGHEHIPSGNNGGKSQFAVDKAADHHDTNHNNNNTLENAPPCCQEDPGAQLDKIQKMADSVQGSDDGNNDNKGAGNDDEEAGEESAVEKKRLMTMSLNTAAAIALHNFPEGLATFVAALDDPSVGAVLAIAIAIHNIPEGLCVAMPVYYGTGNRWQAFMWAVFSGLSEPFAALVGWAILANSFSQTLYGVLFGLVAGMMIIISIRELLPTAHRYDPQDSVVTYAYILGMIVMALSLTLLA